MTKRFGFTLAEVLITLGIIGVVAAMSIPTLIANTNSAKFRSQFKKTVATLNQAALMSQAQYDFDYSGATEESNTANLDPKGNTSVAAMLSGTLSGVTITATSPYTAASTTEPAPTSAPANKMYAKLADGSFFVFNSAAIANGCSVEAGTPPETYINTLATAGCIGYVDVNGATKPNLESVCDEGASGLATTANTACTVKADAAHTRDIYPVVYHDGIVEPATYAARTILSTAK